VRGVLTSHCRAWFRSLGAAPAPRDVTPRLAYEVLVDDEDLSVENLDVDEQLSQRSGPDTQEPEPQRRSFSATACPSSSRRAPDTAGPLWPARQLDPHAARRVDSGSQRLDGFRDSISLQLSLISFTTARERAF